MKIIKLFLDLIFLPKQVKIELQRQESASNKFQEVTERHSEQTRIAHRAIGHDGDDD